MNKSKINIKIVNWLLTRRCNLKCSYCGIINEKIPERCWEDVYFDMKLLHKLYEPFHILYGGEPLLYKGLDKLILACNYTNIPYTIITNNSEGVQKKLQELLDNVDYIQGLTSSVDPLIFDPTIMDTDDRFKKSFAGYERLIALSKTGKIKDLVAEITVCENSIEFLEPLVKNLSDNNISSSITFIDIKKNKYYDFSNVTDESLLVNNTDNIQRILKRILDKGLDVHMGKELIDRIVDILPANYDCKFEECLHNLTVDADGKLRLCLRIGGELVKTINVIDLLTNTDKNLTKFRIDKKLLCDKCNWTCPLMSELAIKGMDDILKHTNKRQ